MIYETLLREKIAAAEDFLEPPPASDDDVWRVHTTEYIEKLKGGTLSPSELMRLEIPWSPEMVQACWLAAGGPLLAGPNAPPGGFFPNIDDGILNSPLPRGQRL